MQCSVQSYSLVHGNLNCLNRQFSELHGFQNCTFKIVILILWNGFWTITPKNLTTDFKNFVKADHIPRIFLKAVIKFFAVTDQSPFYNINITILQ